MCLLNDVESLQNKHAKLWHSLLMLWLYSLESLQNNHAGCQHNLLTIAAMAILA